MTAATKRPGSAGERDTATAAKAPLAVPRSVTTGQFTAGNPGRVPGTKNKPSEARDWALPLVPEVLAWRRKHRAGCDAAKDCAMCRHYNDMVLHYAYGKPPQRHELIQATAKADTLRLAKELGLSETETKQALAEVDRALAAARSSQ